MIARKPKTPAPKGKPVNVDALIRRGGSAASASSGADRVPVLLKVPRDILELYDQAAKERDVPTHRSTVILEALADYLKRLGLLHSR